MPIRPADIQPSISQIRLLMQRIYLHIQCGTKSLHFKKFCYSVKVKGYIIFKRDYEG